MSSVQGIKLNYICTSDPCRLENATRNGRVEGVVKKRGDWKKDRGEARYEMKEVLVSTGIN